ncbi:hypothetical protein HN832_04845 [archaeon]|mgnify:CR=1 FL=1|jgi:histidyl-tRNA synthetase|nr:hypothetical protein [archaeon]MBT4374015.1 hypothetical protein [archaeon]MBT4532111.1 hypothetical protein [archaeon]MBT7002001.1 hypothetical protein [archaeon]MBT7282712.1 hypothetical protein [archaeon]
MDDLIVPGVLELYGSDARKFRGLIRSVEDTFDGMGFDQISPGLLGQDRIFKENLDFLGERFLDNLVYVGLKKEEGVVILPEGTMRTYDFIKRNELEQARIFYCQQFVRNEDPREVAEGKTRNFWQAGCEIFGYDWLNSSVDVMTTAYSIMESAGLPDAVVRFTDKRLLYGLINSFPIAEQEKIRKNIENADDDSTKFLELCTSVQDGEREHVSAIASFLDLAKTDLSLDSLKDISTNEVYQEGIQDLVRLSRALPSNVNQQVLPFMAKSWDACDKLLFDVRVGDYSGALAGGGNLTYNHYMPEKIKSGMGVGVTRLFEVQTQRGK